jgi:hypothetical protein
MITEEIKNSLKKAIRDLSSAEEELNRPKTDIVTMSVCFATRAAMQSMLRDLLLSRSIAPENGQSLASLVQQCTAIDAAFGQIDISKVFCHDMSEQDCHNRYCLSPNAVKNCFLTAGQLKEVVLKNLELSEAALA